MSDPASDLLQLTETTDEQLMLDYAGGDSCAFNNLYQRHKDPLWRFFLRNGLSQQEAQEIHQEVWIRIINAAAKYQPKARFTTWLYHIARNLLIDKHRQVQLVTDASEFEDEVCDNTAINQDEAQAKQSILANCMKKLPTLQLEVFVLKQESGLTMPEIAEITDATQEASKSRLRYAVEALTQCVEKHWGKSL